MRIAIQGEEASFHDTAAKQRFGADCVTVPCESFSEVFGTLNRHEADAAVIAIENSLYGGINQVYDLIESHGYPITGEVLLPIHQQLIGTPNSEITHIYSHPVALAQCENFLDTNYSHATRVEFHDTAGAVRFVKESGNPAHAAIANREAAQLHDLPVLEENIEDNPANFTRFLIIQPGGTPLKDANRTSLVLTTTHTPGALARILTIFAEHKINLSKLQSRPIIGKPWHYRFYLVLDTAGEPLHAALATVQPLTTSITILGEYRAQPL
jgi:prephenate dehydratase